MCTFTIYFILFSFFGFVRVHRVCVSFVKLPEFHTVFTGSHLFRLRRQKEFTVEELFRKKPVGSISPVKGKEGETVRDREKGQSKNNNRE